MNQVKASRLGRILTNDGTAVLYSNSSSSSSIGILKGSRYGLVVHAGSGCSLCLFLFCLCSIGRVCG